MKKIYQQFGINLGEYNGDESWTLPMPSRLVIDRDGVVCHTEINPDYTQRPDPEETLAVLKSVV